jgi:hypothetical protein
LGKSEILAGGKGQPAGSLKNNNKSPKMSHMTKKQEYKYFTLWRQACEKQGWSSSDNEKRHEIHVQAMGFDMSHKFMENREVDRIFTAIRLLIDDTNLDAAIAAVDPDREERKRLVWRIKKLASEGYYRSICVDRFRTTQWDDLNVSQLTQLRNTLANRMAAKKRQAAAQASTEVPVMDTAESLPRPALEAAVRPENRPF